VLVALRSGMATLVKEAPWRSAAKGVSWRLIATLVTTVLSFVLTVSCCAACAARASARPR
jgi:hypothetical protein